MAHLLFRCSVLVALELGPGPPIASGSNNNSGRKHQKKNKFNVVHWNTSCFKESSLPGLGPGVLSFFSFGRLDSTGELFSRLVLWRLSTE